MNRKMDQITRTDGLYFITETIFMNLDYEKLEKCMKVNPFWDKLLSNPQFWLKKCLQKEKKSLEFGSRVNGNEWLELIQTLKSKKFKETATFFLKEIFKHHWTFAACHGSPINISYEYDSWKFFGHILKNLSESDANKALIERINHAAEVCNYQKLKALLVFTKDLNFNDLNAPEFAEKNLEDNFFAWSPIQKAVFHNHPEIVEILIPYTANPNAPTPIEWTPLQIAASSGFSEIVKILAPLTSSPNAVIPVTPDSVSRKFNLGYGNGEWTPLQVAIEEAWTNLEDYTEVVKILAPLVDNPNVQNLYGCTSLQVAAEEGYTDIFKLLASRVENPNAPHLDGWTSLQVAALKGYTEIFKFLAPQVENPNAPNPDGWTPLHIAASEGHTEIFLYLAPQVENPNAPNSDGLTSLQLAAYNRSTEIFKFLAPLVENPNAPDPDGWTPLHIAAWQGNINIFKFLAPQVANPDAPAPNGHTPLQLAKNNNRKEIVEFLAHMHPRYLAQLIVSDLKDKKGKTKKKKGRK